MKTKYILQSLTPDKKKLADMDVWENKKHAIADYQKYCEDNPHHHYRIVKQVTTEETIAESDDHRQEKFSFAH